jgi:uncharacterized protein with HEPN domain
MASREVQKLLFDMKQAGELIETFVLGRSFEEYHGDAMLKSAVERRFGIIDFHNRLIHGYTDVSARVVWGVVEADLPVLLAEVKTLLEAP